MSAIELEFIHCKKERKRKRVFRIVCKTIEIETIDNKRTNERSNKRDIRAAKWNNKIK